MRVPSRGSIGVWAITALAAACALGAACTGEVSDHGTSLHEVEVASDARDADVSGADGRPDGDGGTDGTDPETGAPADGLGEDTRADGTSLTPDGTGDAGDDAVEPPDASVETSADTEPVDIGPGDTDPGDTDPGDTVVAADATGDGAADTADPDSVIVVDPCLCPLGCDETGACIASVCGDGEVEDHETCDPPGTCPVCDDGDACTTDATSGSPDTCDVVCAAIDVTACSDGDGCCAPGCSANDDDDCDPACGNGVVEAGETCDPAAACGTCNDGDACTIDTTSGSAQRCTLACEHRQRTQCSSGDGCCPAACSHKTDADCPIVCGNGVIETGETCDPPGSCPTSCSDGNACTADTLEGSAAACTARCVTSAIAACTDGDGCCPAACGPSDSDCPTSVCGNGALEENETCDPTSNCPRSCNDNNACTSDTLVGDWSKCTSRCIHGARGCGPSDGCCPTGCNANQDPDCDPDCGNGIIEQGETCDMPATCPSSCNDNNACTVDTKSGASATCNVSCTHVAATCKNNDGCCPAGCNRNNDNNCQPQCGNGVVEQGETCDPPGSCPTSCSDGVGCTRDTLTGSAAQCNVSCTSSAITTCANSDTCCPAGCTSGNDSDCANACGGQCADGDGCCPTGCDVLEDDDCELDCTDDASWPSAWKAYETQIVTLTNQRRAAGATCGGTPYPAVPALSNDPLLRMAARCHAVDMATHDFIGHSGSDGRTPDERVSDTGYNWVSVGENLAGGFATPTEVVNAWMASPSHCVNIMSTLFTEIGVGFVNDPQSVNVNHWAQDFGDPQ